MRALFFATGLDPIWAADVTGSWSGPVEAIGTRKTRSGAALLILKQEGTKITGLSAQSGR